MFSTFFLIPLPMKLATSRFFGTTDYLLPATYSFLTSHLFFLAELPPVKFPYKKDNGSCRDNGR